MITTDKKDNKCIAYIKNKNTNDITKKIYFQNSKKVGKGINEVNDIYTIQNNIFRLMDTDTYELSLSPEIEDGDQTNRIVLIGQSGSGKTYFLAEFLNGFKDKYPKHDILLFSRHEKDPSIDRVKEIQRINITEEDVIDSRRSGVPLFDLENLKKTFCVFDDVFGSSQLLNKFYVQLLNDLEQNSRKYQCHLGIVIHNSCYHQTRLILSESNTFVFFLRSSAAMNKRIIKTYLGYDNKKADKLLSIDDSRYLIMRNSAPLFLMTENQIFTEKDIYNI